MRDGGSPMISFDLNATLLFNNGIDVFSIFIILILYFNGKQDFAEMHDTRLFETMEIGVILVMGLDILLWDIDGRMGQGMRFLDYAGDMVYYVLQMGIAMIWFVYVYSRCFRKKMPRSLMTALILVPGLIFLFCILSTPVTGWCFYFDEANHYHRGILAPMLAITAIGYLIVASFLVLGQYKKEVLLDRRKELQVLSVFPLPPFFGGLCQTLFYGCSIVWPSMTLSFLLIFINMENLVISQDYLTGMNNRGYLIKYLQTVLPGETFVLIMADINHFKRINDHFGHDVGDKALIQTADILRKTFKNTTAFLSRYGGDEFVIVLPGSDEKDAERTMAAITESFEAFNAGQTDGYRLTISMGYAVARGGDGNEFRELFKEADQNMYKDKACHRKE